MDTVNTNIADTFSQSLMACARAFDATDHEAAMAHLRDLPLINVDASYRLLALAMWKRAVVASAADHDLSREQNRQVLKALDMLGRAASDEAYIWNAYAALPELEALLGPSDAAAAVIAIFWDRVLKGHEGVFVATFELFFRGGDLKKCRMAWDMYLTQRPDYVPSYWVFLLYCKTMRGTREEVDAATSLMLEQTGRTDLSDLVGIYRRQMRQDPPAAICKQALALSNKTHVKRVAEYMTGIGFAQEDIRDGVTGALELMERAGMAEEPRQLMRARLANAERRWDDTIACAQDAAGAKDLANAARLLSAHALAHTGEIKAARQHVSAVFASGAAPSFLQAHATFVELAVNMLDQGLTTPDQASAASFAPTSGRPLAQSLWVGKRLRWVERLAIRSYLDNGWRFQLYAYDEIDNVPEGCEVLDANAIVPVKDVFREGNKSGLHAGSVGAFSDLFRYRMLEQRGGMWTDTDVINLKKFDPDGRSFVSSDTIDAGLFALNGAIMAAPAHSAFVTCAYERSLELLHGKELVFTRIGPHLLAELLLEFGVDTLEVMPPNFLSAISWMNTATLLHPYDSVMARLEACGAVNLHVYTEMWRMLGLGLDAPPAPDTFLGHLYAQYFPDEDKTHWKAEA